MPASGAHVLPYSIEPEVNWNLSRDLALEMVYMKLKLIFSFTADLKILPYCFHNFSTLFWLQYFYVFLPQKYY